MIKDLKSKLKRKNIIKDLKSKLEGKNKDNLSVLFFKTEKEILEKLKETLS